MGFKHWTEHAASPGSNALHTALSRAQARVLLAHAEYEATDVIYTSALRMRARSLAHLNAELQALEQIQKEVEAMENGG